MKEEVTCKAAIEKCLEEKYFSVARLHTEEKVMELHLHDNYEIYYSVTGAKKFLIHEHIYDISPGDLFVINQYESHQLTNIDNEVHERIVVAIHPDHLYAISTESTDLAACFTDRSRPFCHRISLGKIDQSRFLYYISKITTHNDYGSDIIEQAAFMELMVFINSAFAANRQELPTDNEFQYNQLVEDMLAYINENITEKVTVEEIANQFLISPSYAARIFKKNTGSTISKYIIARRISIAKSLLSTGMSVNEACERSGFTDYSNFLKTFTKTVGISPKQYSLHSTS